MTNIFSHSSLSNDPGKTGSSFLFYGAILFPHVGIFSLSHRECLTLQKGGVGNKMYLNSILKGFFLCLKIWTNHRSSKKSPRKVYNFTCSSHRISVLLRLRRDFVIRKLIRKQGINIHAALRKFRKI